MKQTPPAADAPWSAPPLPAAAAKLACVGADVGEGVGAGVRAGLGTRVGAVFGVACRLLRGRSGVEGIDGASSTGQSSYGISKTEQSPLGISESQSGAAVLLSVFGVVCRLLRGRSGVEGVDGASFTGQSSYGIA